MERFEIAGIIIALSAVIGLLSAVAVSVQEGSSSERVEEVHEHALFHVIINGSELDFTGERFQLNAGYVHLENNKSDIVHTHREGVTWQEFLDTINTSFYTSNSTGNLCVEVMDRTDCGDGLVVLNGEERKELDTVISQGDNLLIVLDTDKKREVVEEYMKHQLPRLYKPERIRGRRV